jgi:nucleoside-diphosphate-sugar epimerase
VPSSHVLVTGGGGFVGSNIVLSLMARAEEECRVTLVEREPLPAPLNDVLASQVDRVQCIALDLTSRSDVEKILRSLRKQPTAVVHAAALTNPPVHHAASAMPFNRANVKATVNLLECVSVGDAIAELVHAADLRHRVYNVASGRFTAVSELVGVIQATRPYELVDTVDDIREADIDLNPGWRSASWGAYNVGRIVTDTNWHAGAVSDRLLEYLRWVEEDPDVRCP